MDYKSKIILIAGPTASGKSKIAINLAKKINGEIVERPQHMWLRVSLGIHFKIFSLEAVKETYDLMISKYGHSENLDNLKSIKDLDLREPEFTYNNDIQFVRAMHKCIDYINFTTPRMNRVPYEMVVAQAALESGWGTSRFAKEGHNLFGIRTYDLTEPHMLPSNNPKKWGVRVYMHECDSVKHYMDILTNGESYTKYRELINQGVNDPYKLIETLDAYASDKNYFSKIKNILKSRFNSLSVKTHEELNETLFKMMKSEKLIVSIIMIMIVLISVFNVIGMDSKEFPPLPELEEKKEFSFDREELIAMLKSVSYAQWVNEERYMLKGVFFQLLQQNLAPKGVVRQHQPISNP